MTISPDYARAVAARVRAYYQTAEDDALARIIVALGRGLDLPDWQARKALDLTTVLRVIDEGLARLDDAAPELITRAVAEAYQAGTGAAWGEVRAAGALPIGGRRASRAVDVLAEDTVRALSGMRPRIIRAVSDVYQQVTADTAGQVLTGGQSRREAAYTAVREYARQGVRPFVDSSGRRWETGAYAEMATRTTAGQAAIAGHTDQLEVLGQDLVIVSTSPESCDLCGPWEGKVLSISGRSRGKASDGVRIAGTIASARSAGLQHPNCTHTVGLYLPGRTKPHTTTRDPEAYKVRQQQRAKERGIRQSKRDVLIAEETLGKDSPAAKAARVKLRGQQASFKAWREDHGRKDLAYRTSLTAR
ncbi:hypothetical protein GCM10009592_14580 [Brachybacterium rhamnosum]|uniref:Phage minor capsid protein n=1 Tax=Brachybacterium rhamnosum TaxID=173361 RepID=A0ABW4Q043_9MICO